MKINHPGRAWAYVGTIFGVTISAGANFVETVTNPEVPNNATAIAAGFMGLLPVGLFISLEVLVRNRIKEHLAWWRAGMMLAAISFAVPSFLHMRWLLLDWGQGEVIATITPFGWDAVMLLSTLALLLDPERAQRGDGLDTIDADVLARALAATHDIEGHLADMAEREAAERAQQKARQRKGKVGTPTVTGGEVKKPRARRYLRGGQESHPLYATWKAEFFDKGLEWEPADFAEKDDTTVEAARRRLARWHEREKQKSQPQVEGQTLDETVDHNEEVRA